MSVRDCLGITVNPELNLSPNVIKVTSSISSTLNFTSLKFF